MCGRPSDTITICSSGKITIPQRRHVNSKLGTSFFPIRIRAAISYSEASIRTGVTDAQIPGRSGQPFTLVGVFENPKERSLREWATSPTSVPLLIPLPRTLRHRRPGAYLVGGVLGRTLRVRKGQSRIRR